MSTVLILANSSAGLYDFRRELLEALLGGGIRRGTGEAADAKPAAGTADLEPVRVVVSVPDDVKTTELRRMGVIVEHAALDRHGTNPVAEWKLYRYYLDLIGRYRPDMTLTYTIKPNLYGALACRKKKVPYIVTVTGLGAAFSRGGLLRTYAQTMYRHSLADASCVFFQNEENLRVFRGAGLLAGKSRLVAGSGVNLERFTPEAYPEDETVRFLFVGRMMRIKGIAEYIEAARALHDERTHFYIVGYQDGDCGELIRGATEDGSISYLGFHKDVRPFYRAMSAVVLPSHSEGMSNVLLEGAATGRPLIASDISGCREIVEDGVNGFLFPAEDGEALTEALTKFLRLPKEQRAEMGAHAREKVQEIFDRKKVVDAYMEEIGNGIV